MSLEYFIILICFLVAMVIEKNKNYNFSIYKNSKNIDLKYLSK